ncbi:centromere protein X-like isoform X2 [Gigantopelta aegis]|uniref:centromere protein X-like isoform X2 n=1 Tax=Gigantopelta aegis TaxID=1735272 RepID=UPI001B8897E1|nr:centromere protein X-like isoform X2 [Gigantopelta aegis]
MEEGATFKKKTVQSILQMNFKDDKTKVHPDAVFLFTEVLRVFVAEGASRAANQAKIDGSEEVGIDHFEKVLPQLLLDM